MIENLDVFNFHISQEDMQKIYKLNKNKRLNDIPGIQNHPDYPFTIPKAKSRFVYPKKSKIKSRSVQHKKHTVKMIVVGSNTPKPLF